MPGYNVHNVFHARNLTPFDEGLEFEVRKSQALPDHVQPDSGQEMWVVQKLAERGMIGAKHYYFVIYEGCDNSEGEWILREDLLEDCPDLVNEFDLKSPLPPNKTTVRREKQAASKVKKAVKGKTAPAPIAGVRKSNRTVKKPAHHVP